MLCFDPVPSLTSGISTSITTTMAEEEKKRFMEGNDMELGEKQGRTFSAPNPSSPRPMQPNRKESPIAPVLSYCASSIMMTVANKYILSFPEFNLNFFLLAVQVGQPHQGCVDCADMCSVGYCLHCRNQCLQICWYNHLQRLQD